MLTSNIQLTNRINPKENTKNGIALILQVISKITGTDKCTNMKHLNEENTPLLKKWRPFNKG